ncbi:MAG: ATP-binding protein [Terriglobia bacterium]
MEDAAKLEALVIEEHKFASLGRLLAGIVHEINTPIGSIFSNNEVILRSLELLRKDLMDCSPTSLARARQIVDTCRSLAQVDKIACDRIALVVRGLRVFARTADVEFRPVDLGEQIANTLKLVHGEFRRRVTFETEIEDLPQVVCNAGKINQVLLNLIVNAGQAIEGEGRITITARREADQVHVAIADTGPGIPVELRDRIFRAGFTTKNAGEGTGLGLNISKRIIEEIHHGSLTFESEPGEGTTFHMKIPIGAASGE